MLIPKQAGAWCSRGVSPPPNQSREPCRALQQTSTASRSSALPPQRRIRRVRRGRAALPMPCTAARRYATFLPLLLCSLGGWPRLALLDKQAGRHSMDHLLLLLWPAALSPVARPGPARTSSPPPSDRAGVDQRTIHHPSISLKRRDRGHPLLIDRDPASLLPPSPSPADSQLQSPSSIAGLTSAPWPQQRKCLVPQPATTAYHSHTSRPAA